METTFYINETLETSETYKYKGQGLRGLEKKRK